MTRRQASLGKEGGNVMAIEVCLADLQRLGACEDARTAFAQRFPDGASYRELLLAMADHPHGIDWWEWFAPRVKALCRIREAYAAQKRPLWEQYDAARRQAIREAAATLGCDVEEAQT